MIYFDNSATSYPKPHNFYHNIYSAFNKYSFNIGRSSYRASMKAAEKVFEVRELAADLFGFKTERVIFTKNCTEALNTAIKGIVNKGDEIIISPLEHNSVLRVVNKLSDEGIIDYSIAEYSNNSNNIVNNFEKLITDKTKAIVCTFASNVFGVRMPVKEIGELCKRKGIYFILDASQGAGICDINANRDNIDILCTSGHKALYGAMGTGILALKEGVEINTVLEGGTGSNSLELSQPEILPDRFESGTLNVPGIYLLGEGLKFIKKVSTEEILHHEINLINSIYDSLFDMDNIFLYTQRLNFEEYVPILSLNIKGKSSESTAAYLADNGICTRGGYHCSPLSHRAFNTLESGTVRISTGYFNSKKECKRFIKVIKNF